MPVVLRPLWRTSEVLTLAPNSDLGSPLLASLFVGRSTLKGLVFVACSLGGRDQVVECGYSVGCDRCDQR